jgi:hypothetical protein
MREVERELLAEDLARADIDVPGLVVEGRAYRRVLRGEETYMTAAGAVRVERTLYKDRSGEAERAIVPTEMAAGIVAGFWTPMAARKAAWVVAQMTPQTAEELFARVGNMAPSKGSLDRSVAATNFAACRVGMPWPATSRATTCCMPRGSGHVPRRRPADQPQPHGPSAPRPTRLPEAAAGSPTIDLAAEAERHGAAASHARAPACAPRRLRAAGPHGHPPG